ncbi:MAG: hypothetical protein HZA01_06575 [Nitrospinae bacterium]|nr:hypothetical protein [Nitrospinota bacterium]
MSDTNPGPENAFIEEFLLSLQAASAGDLTKRITASTVDPEFEKIKEAYNAFLDMLVSKIEAMMGVFTDLAGQAVGLETDAEAVAKSVESTNGYIKEMAEFSSQVGANIESIADSSKQVTLSINDISKNASQAANIVSSAVATTEKTSRIVARFEESSKKIDKVIRSISAIAKQTNLLALNATIEAARAGDAGKGFAVVAKEVKDLSRETTAATDDITQNVETIFQDSAETRKGTQEIREVMNKINDYSTSIAGAVEEQYATTNEIAGNLERASRGVKEIISNIEKTKENSNVEVEQAGKVMEASRNIQEISNRFSEIILQFST